MMTEERKPDASSQPSEQNPYPDRISFDDWWNQQDYDLPFFYACREAWQTALAEGKRRAATNEDPLRDFLNSRSSVQSEIAANPKPSDLRERLEVMLSIAKIQGRYENATTLREVLDKPHLLLGEPVARVIHRKDTTQYAITYTHLPAETPLYAPPKVKP